MIFDGIYQEDVLDSEGEVLHAAGSLRFRDISGPDGTPDGVIDGDDATILGGPLPDVTYGFSGNVTYRGFDFSFILAEDGFFIGSAEAIESVNGVYASLQSRGLRTDEPGATARRG